MEPGTFLGAPFEPHPTQEFADSILQKPSDHNDYLGVIPMDQFSVGPNAMKETGRLLPEPATVAVLAAGAVFALFRKFRKSRV